MLTAEEKGIAWDLARKEGRIVPWKKYGEHIELTCRNHPDQRWSTKNIGFIGFRTIFYRSEEAECSCKADQLIPVEPENWDLVQLMYKRGMMMKIPSEQTIAEMKNTVPVNVRRTIAARLQQLSCRIPQQIRTIRAEFHLPLSTASCVVMAYHLYAL